MSPTYNIYTSPRKPRETHFSEIIADTIDWDIICLSHVGFSNFGIVDQLKTAISINPDLIIFNTTSFDRNEFVIDYNKNHCSAHSQYPILKYLHYDYFYIRQLLKQDNITPYMISLGLSSPAIPNYYIGMAHNLDKNLGKKVEESAEHIENNIKSLLSLYDATINYFYDSVIINYTILEIIESKIPFICMMDYLNLIEHKHHFQSNNYILPWQYTKDQVELENNKAGYTFETALPFHTMLERQKSFAETILISMSQQDLI